MFVILPDWPSTSKWLSPLEQEYVVHHLHKDAPKQTAKTWDAQQIKRMFSDPTFYFFSLFWACECSCEGRRRSFADSLAPTQATPSRHGASAPSCRSSSKTWASPTPPERNSSRSRPPQPASPCASSPPT